MLGLSFAALVGLAAPQPTALLDARVAVNLHGAGGLATDGHGHEHQGSGLAFEGGAYRVLSDWLALGVQLGYRPLFDRQNEDPVNQHGLSAVPTLRVGARGRDSWHLFGELGLGYTLLIPTDGALSDRFHMAEGRLGGGITWPLSAGLDLQAMGGFALNLGTSDSGPDARSPEYTDDVFSVGARLEVGLGLLWHL